MLVGRHPREDRTIELPEVVDRRHGRAQDLGDDLTRPPRLGFRTRGQSQGHESAQPLSERERLRLALGAQAPLRRRPIDLDEGQGVLDEDQVPTKGRHGRTS